MAGIPDADAVIPPQMCIRARLLPSVAPALAMAMLALVAWSLSVVDVAILLGPGNPPTLAVISWQWLTQGDIDQQTKGALASLLLMLLLAAYVLLSYLPVSYTHLPQGLTALSE